MKNLKIDPKGWISDAFDAMESHVDERLDQLERKMDLILKNLTGVDS